MTEHNDQDIHFHTAELEDDLRGRSVGGGAVTMAAQACKFVLVIGSTMVLARLLSVADFGLFAGVMAVAGFAERFKDLGLSMSTVQRERISHDQVSTLFWINAGFGLLVASLVAASAPAVAWYFKQPQLTAVTLVLSISFIAGGLTVQHQALLRRKMRFTALAAVELLAMFAGILAAIAAASAGLRYWALVVMHLVIVLFTMAGVWIACRWRPGPPRPGSGVRPMIVFGGHLSGTNICQYISRNLDKVLVGRYCGVDALGLYSKAFQLLMLPVVQINIPLTGVAIPALSRLQNDPLRYRDFFRSGIQILVFSGMPVVAFMFVAAEDLVLAILGPQWPGAVPVFRVLAPAAMVGTFNVATGWVYLSLGRTRRQFRWVLFGSTITSLSFFAGLPWGIMGVAAAFSITVVTLRLPGMIYCFRGTPIRLVHLLDVIWRPAVASCTAGALLFLLRSMLLPGAALPLRLVLDGVVFALAYFLIWMLLPRGRSIIREMICLLPLITGRPEHGASERQGGRGGPGGR